MRYVTGFAVAAALVFSASRGPRAVELQTSSSLSSDPVIYWSHQAQRAIVPSGPGGSFGSENYGNKFPGEAAVYMGIVHAAIMLWTSVRDRSHESSLRSDETSSACKERTHAASVRSRRIFARKSRLIEAAQRGIVWSARLNAGRASKRLQETRQELHAATRALRRFTS